MVETSNQDPVGFIHINGKEQPIIGHEDALIALWHARVHICGELPFSNDMRDALLITHGLQVMILKELE